MARHTKMRKRPMRQRVKGHTRMVNGKRVRVKGFTRKRRRR